MTPQIVSRTQRRMEKKQALLLLVLVLAVALVSFALGVMVGRGSAGPEPDEAALEPQRRPVAREETSPPPAEEKTASPAAEEKELDLTFFDTLPKGDQPLGSGINLPPEKDVQAPAQEPASAPKAAESPVRKAPPEKSPPAATEPAAIPQGAWVVQVASFKGPQDAGSLRDKLAAKGYDAFVQKADLGEKGTWHRVLVGPYASSEAAGQVVSRLKAEEKLTGLVRKR